MADIPDTPPPPTDAPATPRRRQARANGAAKPANGRRGPRKLAAEKTAEAVKTVAPRAKRAVAKVADAATAAVKPATKRSTTRGKTRAATATAKAPRKAPAKTAKTSTKKAAGPGKWGVAAIAGGVVAAGAAAAALLSLKGSTPKTAHQPDGKDSSKSFDAGIADENIVPN